jgi:RNA polymerase subunit RPABC4/transcription elongation factor Spt4
MAIKRQCTKCGYITTTSKDKCPKCKTLLPVITPTSPTYKELICPNCNVKTDKNNICPKCHGKIIPKKKCNFCRHLFSINDTRCPKCKAGTGDYTIVCTIRNSSKKPTPPTPPPPKPIPPKPHKKRWRLLWLLVALALIALLIWGFKNYQDKQKLIANPTPTITVTITPTLRPTQTPTPKPTTKPTTKPAATPTVKPISKTRIETQDGKWTKFSKGDTVIGWAISINGYYYQDKNQNGVVLRNAPVEGYVIGGKGVINPNDSEITNQMVITHKEVMN